MCTRLYPDSVTVLVLVSGAKSFELHESKSPLIIHDPRMPPSPSIMHLSTLIF